MFKMQLIQIPLNSKENLADESLRINHVKPVQPVFAIAFLPSHVTNG